MRGLGPYFTLGILGGRDCLLPLCGAGLCCHFGGRIALGVVFLGLLVCRATLLVSVDPSLTLGVLCFLWFILVAVLLFLLTWGWIGW